jgi:hypothetical protein
VLGQPDTSRSATLALGGTKGFGSMFMGPGTYTRRCSSVYIGNRGALCAAPLSAGRERATRPRSSCRRRPIGATSRPTHTDHVMSCVLVVVLALALGVASALVLGLVGVVALASCDASVPELVRRRCRCPGSPALVALHLFRLVRSTAFRRRLVPGHFLDALGTRHATIGRL